MEITKDIKYVGVNDRKIDLFEGQYEVPNGMAYNSYVILDEKIAVMDTVDLAFKDEWFKNLKEVLGGKKPDYLVVHHMEPDHSANIADFIKCYPEAKIVSSEKAFVIMKNFFKTDFKENQVLVGEGDKLKLGNHELTFLTAPMVHWPEVIVSYDSTDKVLFSADGFGKFGALDVEEDWACEARRYYFGIVGKFGGQVQKLLSKASGLDIEIICPLHGPVLNENLEYYLDLYNKWSSYTHEEFGILIEKGAKKVVVTDLARSDMAENVEDAFRYSKLVLATTTYNGEIFPFMREFIHELTERNYSNRKVAFVENGSWMPMAKKVMIKMLENAKNIEYCENSVKILSSLSDDNFDEINKMADELL